MKRLKLIVALCILLNVSIISSAAAVIHPDGTRDYHKPNGDYNYSAPGELNQSAQYWLNPEHGKTISIYVDKSRRSPDYYFVSDGGLSWARHTYLYGRDDSVGGYWYVATIPYNYRGSTIHVRRNAWDSWNNEGDHNYYGNNDLYVYVGYDTAHSHQWGGWVSAALNRSEVTKPYEVY